MLFPKRQGGPGGAKSGLNYKDTAAQKQKKRAPKLEDLVEKRDWSGALGLLQWQLNMEGMTPISEDSEKDQKDQEKQDVNEKRFWMAYAHTHLGDYEQGMAKIQEHLKLDPEPEPAAWLWKAVCLYGLGNWKEAEECALRGPAGQLQNRILFHTAHRTGDEAKLMIYHQKMSNSIEDQLSLASMHFLRGHFQEATDVYKRVLLEGRDNIALNVYVALCYYKLDYYDVALEILQLYLSKHADSIFAVNLKACNHYKLYNGAAAESELKALGAVLGAPISTVDNELLKHNLAVFRAGENALQVFPPLLNVIPEARLNLCIYHLHQGQLNEAQEVIKDLQPSTPEEYILKGYGSPHWQAKSISS